MGMIIELEIGLIFGARIPIVKQNAILQDLTDFYKFDHTSVLENYMS